MARFCELSWTHPNVKRHDSHVLPEENSINNGNTGNIDRHTSPDSSVGMTSDESLLPPSDPEDALPSPLSSVVVFSSPVSSARFPPIFPTNIFEGTRKPDTENCEKFPKDSPPFSLDLSSRRLSKNREIRIGVKLESENKSIISSTGRICRADVLKNNVAGVSCSKTF